MKITIIATDSKHDKPIASSMRKGFKKHAEEVRVITPSDADPSADSWSDMVVMVGVKRRELYIKYSSKPVKTHILHVDKGYFRRREYFRLSLNGFQPCYLDEMIAEGRPTSRLRVGGIALRSVRKLTSGSIIYAGSSQKFYDWHDLGNVDTLAVNTCSSILSLGLPDSIAPVYYRPKPSWWNKRSKGVAPQDHSKLTVGLSEAVVLSTNEMLSTLLPRCYSLVTYGSNSAVEALCSGVPVVILGSKETSPVWHLAGHSLENLRKPFIPDHETVSRTFASMSWCQFTLLEMQSGFAWDTVKRDAAHYRVF